MPRHLVVMGVCGVGKTTIGLALAELYGLPFIEGDDFHPPENIAKMKSGTPLNDGDRWPWLHQLNHQLIAAEQGAVLACSALKHSYRKILNRSLEEVVFIHLTGSPALVEQRLRSRENHFMPTQLIASQFQTLEPPLDAITLDIADPPELLIQEIRERLLGRTKIEPKK